MDMDLSALLPELPHWSAAANWQGLGLPRAARIAFSAATAAAAPTRPLLLLTHRHDRTLVVLEELAAWLGPAAPERLYHFAEPSTLFYERGSWSSRSVQQRIEILAALNAAKRSLASDYPAPAPIVVTSARALMQRTLPPRDFFSATRTLRVGQTIEVRLLLKHWQAIGYRACTVVGEPGQFSQRGGIIDIWAVNSAAPLRIELFDTVIENMRTFDPNNQRSQQAVTSQTIPPAREAFPGHGVGVADALQQRWQASSPLPLPEHHPAVAQDLALLAQGVAFSELEFYLPDLHPEVATLLDYLPQNTLVLCDDAQAFAETVQELTIQAEQLAAEAQAAQLLPADCSSPYCDWTWLQTALSRRSGLNLAMPASGIAEPIAECWQATTPHFLGQIPTILQYLEERSEAEQPTIVVTRQAARFAELWGETHTFVAPQTQPQPGNLLQFVSGTLSSGFSVRRILPNGNWHPYLHIVTDAELFGWQRPEPRRQLRTPPTPRSTPEAHYVAFQLNDYVVHIEHGIGVYLGLVTRTVSGLPREYLHVQYARGEEVYVPIGQADRLTRYVGVDDNTPKLAQLGTVDWARTREKARQAAQEVASELLALYAQRELQPGFAYPPDNAWQHELEAAFPFQETPDQLQAIIAVKVDLERARPMDRLVCGDVGYGKTEVALRAAFKVLQAGKQVAVLAPTTVLAQQHYETFQQRLAAFPVRVTLLSRLRNTYEQKETLQALAKGAIDVVVGTHRLLSADVHFRDLGLLVIDEEQRFGVTHKERLKQFRLALDVLTLSATPIPRTLYFSLTGLRDISVINTPPVARLPIATQVLPFQKRVIRQAILRELDRGGQVFYVHNRVQTIQATQQWLQELVPEARFAIGHGQMPPEKLAKVMDAFRAGELDVLVSTTIIESGLDIPNANTLLVERADTFGLAQLYQLRGRVGRGANRAYAYLFTPSPTELQKKGTFLSAEARERLQTLAEQTELGAGYQIAMRDLELRGAGDILGNRQSGQISAVGFHLYTRLLRQAIQQLKDSRMAGDASNITAPTALLSTLSLISVELPLAIGLPVDYIPDQTMRMQLYRRLAEVETLPDLQALGAELRDRFGAPPEPARNLLYQLHVKLLAHQAGLDSVGHEPDRLTLRKKAWEQDDKRVGLLGVLPNEARIAKGKVWLMRFTEQPDWQPKLLTVLSALAQDNIFT